MVEILAILMFLHILGKIVSSPMLLIGTFLVIAFIVGTIKHWLMNRSLLDRQQFDDEEFGRSFYGGHNVRADLAVRVRRILSDNLERSPTKSIPTIARVTTLQRCGSVVCFFSSSVKSSGSTC